MSPFACTPLPAPGGPRRITSIVWRVEDLRPSGGHGTGLEDEYLIPLDRPLDVLRAAQAPLEVDPDPGQPRELLLVERRALRLLRWQLHLAHAAGRVGHDRVGL